MSRTALLGFIGGAVAIVAAVLGGVLFWPGNAPPGEIIERGTITGPPLPARRIVPEDEVVPTAEIYAQLQAYIDYLIAQKRIRMQSNAVQANSSPLGQGLDGGANDALVKRLREHQVSDHEIDGILASLPDRVQTNLDDFYDANLAPLVVSLRNLRLYHTPVAREDLKRLGAEFEELKTYETALRQDLRAEWEIDNKAADIFLELRKTVREALALTQAWSPRAQAACGPQVGQGANCDVVKTGFLTAKQPILDRRAVLLKQLTALQKRDNQLAEQYSRQYFTFEIPSIYAARSRATPIVDGRVVFGRVAQLLDGIAKNAGGKGYAHMSFWSCGVGTPLTDDKGATFANAIRKVAAAGNEVSILLWEGNSWVFPGVVKSNAQCKRELEQASPNIHVTVAHHSETGAYHQKEMIFYDGNRVVAIVGGLNMDGTEYATPPHMQSELGQYQ
ncbi:MAG: hypothetical protein JO348_01450, partial [Alphaproteobacteria bacterium]|nr:hypothetical protein [Alphaproteobacteria bacterium]